MLYTLQIYVLPVVTYWDVEFRISDLWFILSQHQQMVTPTLIHQGFNYWVIWKIPNYVHRRKPLPLETLAKMPASSLSFSLSPSYNYYISHQTHQNIHHSNMFHLPELRHGSMMPCVSLIHVEPQPKEIFQTTTSPYIPAATLTITIPHLCPPRQHQTLTKVLGHKWVLPIQTSCTTAEVEVTHHLEWIASKKKCNEFPSFSPKTSYPPWN